MAGDIVLGIVLKADGSGLRGEVKLSQAELEKFGQASRGMAQQMTTSTSKMAGAFGSLKSQIVGLAAGYLSVQTAIGIFRSLAREIMETERATATLNAVLGATGGAAGLSARQVSDLADELERTTLFDDNEIMRAAAVMATFKGITGDTFREAIRGAADLAAIFGGDLSSSAASLGKAFEDPEQGLTALRRAGINFTDEQRDLILALKRTGRDAEAAGIILDELKNRIGGTAEAQQTGLVGATNSLADAWGNVQQAFLNSAGARFAADTLNNLSVLVDRSNTALAIQSLRRKEILTWQGWKTGAELATDPSSSFGAQIRELEDLLRVQARARGYAQAGPSAPIGSLPPPLTDGQIKAAQALKDYISDLGFARDQLNRTAGEQAIYNALREAGVGIDSTAGQSIAGLIGQTNFLTQAQAELNAELEAEAALRDQGKALMEALRSPYEIYLDDLRQAQEMLRDNSALLIDQATRQDFYNRAIAAAGEHYKQATDKADDFGRTMADAYHSIGTAFEDAAISGKGLGDVLAALEQDLARIIIRLTVTNPIEQGLTGLLKDFDFGDIFGSIWKSLFGGPVLGTERFAQGGVVTRPTLFPLARGAGLMGEAGAEAVMPLTRLPSGDLGVRAAGGGGEVTVNIINNTGQPATARESRGHDGRRVIEVTVGEAAARDVSGRGPLAQALERNYGLRRGTF
jgi:phage-related minor tail protein